MQNQNEFKLTVLFYFDKLNFYRLGGICAGWLGLLKQYHVYIPTTIYGILAIFFATLAMALPETKGEKIPDTLEEGEQGWNSITFNTIITANLNLMFDKLLSKVVEMC